MNYNYDMVDGVDYTIDLNKPIGQRITKLIYQGKKVENNDEFTISLNSYRALGGGDFDMLKDAPVIQNDSIDFADLVTNYLSKHPVIDFIPRKNIEILK